jgi:glycosyltransferase involved in cell wall biosynthesis
MSIDCQIVSTKLARKPQKRLRQRIAIIIPAYNEAPHLEALITQCLAIGPEMIVVIDDASKDDSAAVLRALLAKHGDRVLQVMQNRQNLGKQGSVRRGLRHVIDSGVELDGVALIDGDGQHDPEELPPLCELLVDGYHVIIGARSQAQMPLQRRLSNGLVNVGYAVIGGVDFVDVQSGFRIYGMRQARWLANGLPEDGGYGIEHESLAIFARESRRRGMSLRAAAVAISCRYGPASSMTLRDMFGLAVHTVCQAARVRRYQGRRLERIERAA